jgi:hypothetical protein
LGSIFENPQSVKPRPASEPQDAGRPTKPTAPNEAIFAGAKRSQSRQTKPIAPNEANSERAKRSHRADVIGKLGNAPNEAN